MPQEQSQKSGEPPIGECVRCHEPVTREDPGTLQFSPSTGAMAHVHDRCQGAAASDATTDDSA